MIKKISFHLGRLSFCLALSLISVSLQASAKNESASKKQEVTRELESVVRSALGSMLNRTSFSLRDSTGFEWVEINGKTPRAPASIAKIVSTGCALEKLGPQFQFHTYFGFTGSIDGDILKGSLVLRGEGDPSLTLEDIREVIAKIRSFYKIRVIQGPLIFDTSYLSSPSLEIGDGFGGDEGRSFATQITPFPLTQNSFAVWGTLNPRDPKSTSATIYPVDVLDLRVQNKSVIGQKTQIAVDYKMETPATITLKGSVNPMDPKGVYRAVPDPYVYYRLLLQKLWQESGGEWQDQSAKIETQPVKMNLLWDQPSKPLAKILMDVNKYSLNLGAELTLLAAAAGEVHKTDYRRAMQLVSSCLQSHNLSDKDLRLTNASGLSREARFQASSLSSFLVEMSNSVYAPEFMSTFSIPGNDGTTKLRLSSLHSWARLKTGSIANVSSIAGYFWPRPGAKAMSFSLIMNEVSPADPKTKSTQDKVIASVFAKLSHKEIAIKDLSSEESELPTAE